VLMVNGRTLTVNRARAVTERRPQVRSADSHKATASSSISNDDPPVATQRRPPAEINDCTIYVGGFPYELSQGEVEVSCCQVRDFPSRRCVGLVR
jgi:hypothetical protein